MRAGPDQHALVFLLLAVKFALCSPLTNNKLPTPKPRRFSSDVSTVDDTLPFMANILLANTASLTGLVTVLTYTEPRLLVALVPLAFLYRCVRMPAALTVLCACHHSLPLLPAP